MSLPPHCLRPHKSHARKSARPIEREHVAAVERASAGDFGLPHALHAWRDATRKLGDLAEHVQGRGGDLAAELQEGARAAVSEMWHRQFWHGGGRHLVSRRVDRMQRPEAPEDGRRRPLVDGLCGVITC